MTKMNTETDPKWTEMKAWIDGLSDEGRANLLERLTEETKRTWKFECCLWRLVEGDDVMECFHNSELSTREPTAEEWAEEQFAGTTLRLPYNWSYDGLNTDGTRKFYESKEFKISKKAWKDGDRWTLRKVVDTMRSFYGKNKNRNLRSLGDHTFFEGVMEDGRIYLGS